jgi:hypothetical protein
MLSQLLGSSSSSGPREHGGAIVTVWPVVMVDLHWQPFPRYMKPLMCCQYAQKVLVVCDAVSYAGRHNAAVVSDPRTILFEGGKNGKEDMNVAAVVHPEGHIAGLSE